MLPLDNILTISNLSLRFGSGKEDAKLMDNLFMQVPREKVTALVGGNGVGKTTLFNVINGIQKGVKGDIRFEGKPILGLPPHKIARLGIGRLFQGAKVFEEMSILHNMMLGMYHPETEIPFYNLLYEKKSSWIEKTLKQQAEGILVTLFGESNPFLENLHQPAFNLSYGQQRLLALARLLMGEYSLYLLDEPTAGVHASLIVPIAETIKRMNSQSHKTVLMIEHNMGFVRQHADYCLFMAERRIIADGTPAQVLDNETVQQIYMGF